MKHITFHFKFSLILLIFVSNYSYAVCEKKANLFRSTQSVFVYAGHQGDKWYLLDGEQRVYLTFFQDGNMIMQKTDVLDSIVFFHLNRLRGFFWVGSNTLWVDSNKVTQIKLNGELIDVDTVLDLSFSSNEMTVFLGNVPQYVTVYKNGAIQLRDWPFLDKNDYFLGGYSVGDISIVLVVHDEKVYFYRSSDSLVWEKSDFSLPSFIKGYTYNNLFWVVNIQGEKYSSVDGVNWQLNMDDQTFNQYVKEYDIHRANLLNDLRASNYIINSIDGDHHEGVVVGSCYKRVDSKIENMGFLLRYKNNQYTMYEDFDNEKPLSFVGKDWIYPSR